jgi:acetoin utilization deacetylase AcuC-like enzyme
MEDKQKVVVVYSSEMEAFDPPGGMYLGKTVPAVEKPIRTQNILASLKAVDSSRNGFSVQLREPQTYPQSHIEAIHDSDYLHFLKTVNSTPVNDAEFVERTPAEVAYPFTFPYVSGISKKQSTSIVAQMGRYCFDTATPITASTWPAAVKAVDCVLTGADALLEEGQRVAYALCRPPGHHAHRAIAGGYCYLNNAAIAAHYLLQSLPSGEKGKVAILDVDFHHGNGTQDIFYDTDAVLFVSLHHTPDGAYPYFSGFEDECGRGQGEGFNVNFPLPSATDEQLYTSTLQQALEKIRGYGPAYLLVSLGFDTFKDDPISSFKLGEEYYTQMGSLIGALHLPTLIISEGGYAIEKLGTLAVNFVSGFLSA